MKTGENYTMGKISVILICCLLEFYSCEGRKKTGSIEDRLEKVENEIGRVVTDNERLHSENVRMHCKTEQLQDENARLKDLLDDYNKTVDSYTRLYKKRAAPEIPVAFTAMLNHDPTHVGVDQTIIFEKTLLNEGNHYNIHTGIFTVPKEGLYMFYFVFAEGYKPHQLWMRIVVDGSQQVAGVADTFANGHDAQGGNMVILHLHPGDSVWVTTFAVPDVLVYGSRGFTTFSGILLFEY